ncbi:hypothetical protein H5410_035019 [Solanum commersonii]|uniref:Uncharacterized protein n=1 Tax=Solanum commersonii TaxID=4109 RepID=A0A9J5XZK0_SOLCO|nr:hypothetical protein H5410_035019 [Solanum commersonii]
MSRFFCRMKSKLLTDERANKHPNLIFFFSPMHLISWDDRMKVATQLMISSHGCTEGIAFGYVSDSCIMIDEILRYYYIGFGFAEVNIKVFDFGFGSNNENEDTKFP